MHDCPRCQVPLHGHEEYCPSCGTKQIVRPEYRSIFSQSQKGFNPVPFALVTLFIGGVLFLAVQNSWIGQAMRRGPEQVDPNSKITPPMARQTLEEKITANLTAVGAKGKFVWMSGEKTVDRNCPDAVELTIDTALHNPQQRREIIDPVKQLMDPGKISSITMNDSRSHATWTYNCIAPPSDNSDDKPVVPDN